MRIEAATMMEASHAARRLVAIEVHTYRDVLTKFPYTHAWLNEYLPDEDTIEDEASPALCERIATDLVRDWKQRIEAAAVVEALEQATAVLRSRLTKARTCLGMNRGAAQGLLYRYLRKAFL